MRVTAIFILFLVSISGCANIGTKNVENAAFSYSENGKKAYTVHCGQGAAAIIMGSSRVNYSGCHELAGSACRTRGYNVLSKDHNNLEGIMRFECK